MRYTTTLIQKLRELRESGLSRQKIADKTGTNYWMVYYYTSKKRREQCLRITMKSYKKHLKKRKKTMREYYSHRKKLLKYCRDKYYKRKNKI